MGRHSAAPKREVEASEYVAMMHRLLAAFGDRVKADPAILVHVPELAEAFSDQVNRGVFEANAGSNHYSQNEMAAMMGVTRQAIAKRVDRGRTVYARVAAARGAGALVRLADVRRRRADLMTAAGVEDKTGSVRELRARAS
jgi:hypothetical protein